MTKILLAGFLVAFLLSSPVAAWAAETSELAPGEKENDAEKKKGILSTGKGLALIGAGLAIGLAALGTGVAQSRIGSAGLGVIAEDPKKLGVVLMLVVIPETLVVFGFLIAILIMDK